MPSVPTVARNSQGLDQGSFGCTYRGTGTQYGVGSNGNDPTDVSTLAAGVLFCCEGRCGLNNLKLVFDRSPPIEGTGETRLLFVVDLIDDPSVEV